MNAKQLIPVIVKIAPPAIIGVAIYLALKELFSGEDAEIKPETAPANAGTESSRKVAETSVFRPIPAEIPAKPAVVPIPSAVKFYIPPFSVPLVSKVSASVPAPQKIAAQIPPPPIKGKFITREDMAAIFHHGARALTRQAAVEALKKRGFGKSAAYAALLENGIFANWLHFAPDGIITWTE
jgi:hypothetical protein